MLAIVLLFALLILATVTDARERRIYNWTTYPGMIAALAINAIGSLLERQGLASETLQSWMGWIGLGESVIGWLACGGVMLVCFVFFRIGGGDVKLMAMVGAFLGLDRGLESLLWTFVIGGCVGLIVLVWRVGAWRLLARVIRHLAYMLRLGSWLPLGPEERRELQPPLFLAPCALAGVVVVQFKLVDQLSAVLAG